MQCCCCGNLPSKYCRRCYSGRVQAKYEYDTAFRDQRPFAWNECRNQRKLSQCSVILEIIHLSVNLWILNFPSILFVKYFINIFSTLKLYFQVRMSPLSEWLHTVLTFALSPGLHGRDCVRQIHQADHEGRDHPLLQKRLDHCQERLHVPRLQDSRPQVKVYYLVIWLWSLSALVKPYTYVDVCLYVYLGIKDI